MVSESLSHSLVSDSLQKGATLLMAPILYSRRQVEWEPASNLIEGVCLTLQRQPIISFLPHLRSLINVCVNLVSSQVAILWNFTKFNSAIDFSELKIYRSTYLPTHLPMKTDGSGDTENSEVHFKVVCGDIKGPVPLQMGFWCAASHALLWQLTSSSCAESWGLPVGEWGGGRLHNWLEVEVVWGGGD